MHLTYKYRLLIRKRDHYRLAAVVEMQRGLYNSALFDRREHYKETGKGRTFYDQCKMLTGARARHTDMAAVPANLQRGTLRRADRAYCAFLNRVKRGEEKPGFPRFKGAGQYDTLQWDTFSGVRLIGNRLVSRVFGRIKIHAHRLLPDPIRIKACTVVRDAKGWYVCFAVEEDVPEKCVPENPIGIDMGLTHFATTSDGEHIPSLRAARKSERALRIAERHKSRCKKGSRGRHQARKRVARCHLKVKNQRRTYAHQTSSRMVRKYDLIAMEKLNITGMTRSRLAKSIHDAGWGMVSEMLQYKAERAGTHVVRVDPKYTSQDCSSCGHREPKPLSQRVHQCARCGLTLDRDHNAAINILNKGVVALGERNVVGGDMRVPEKIS